MSEEETRARCGMAPFPFGSLTLRMKRVEGGDGVKLLNACTCGDDGGDCAMYEASDAFDGLAVVEATALTLKRCK